MWNSYLWPIGTCWLTMKKFYLLQRPPAPLRCPWEEWYTDDSLNQAKTSSHAVKKKLELVYTHTKKGTVHTTTPTHSSQCWCQDHCGCAWHWCGWEAVMPTACLRVSLSECIGAWRRPTTWPSSPTWWATMIRISHTTACRWALVTLHNIYL